MSQQERDEKPCWDPPIQTIINAETSSVSSESSVAIVSLYNSWSANSTTMTTVAAADVGELLEDDEEEDDRDGDDDDNVALTLDDRFSFLPSIENVDSEDLFDELRKRLPSADLPPRIRKYQRRHQPTCRFVNYFGSRLPPLPLPRSPPVPVGSSVNPLNELGLDEKDALFPLVVDGPLGDTTVTSTADDRI